MKAQEKRRDLDKINFSIGAKMVTIISIIVVLSLGSITAMVSLLIRWDLETTAVANNMDINRISAIEAGNLLSNVHNNTRAFIQTRIALGSQTSIINESTASFWAGNPDTAAVFYLVSGRPEQIIVNDQFVYIANKNITSAQINSYFNSAEIKSKMGDAVRGRTILLNAAPNFSKAIIAMFFQLQNGGVGGVLFSTENLNHNFKFEVNQSYMISVDGDLLCHTDLTLVRNAPNIADLEFIHSIIKNPAKDGQKREEDDFGIMENKPRPIEKKEIDVIIIEEVMSLVNKGINHLADIGVLNLSEKDGKKSRQYVAYTKLNPTGAIVITSIDYDTIFESIDRRTRHNIYLTIAVLAISIIFVWFFAKSISVPIKSLAVAARQIEGGKFDLEFQLKNRDEIGVLASSFGKMCSALKVFGKFTNREIAVKAMRGEIKPGGLAKNATVFFSDIREFTAKSEHFTSVFGAEASDKIVYWLNHYFTHMIDCIEKTNGVVDKFIGDAVMAHWGTAYTVGSARKDAFNCVKAALMMRKALYFMNKERKAGDPANPFINIGCGINSGIVTAGQLGSDQRMEYTVIGDPVNLASRIESLTKPLGVDILISEDTWRLIGDLFLTDEMPSVTVKGKSKPVRVFAVINFAGEPKGPQSIDEVRSLLGVDVPDLEEIDLNADEKKYKIGENS
ncbi:MAG: HAMP domain-containing protein [Treponema sp.]|nr:HAMP domain-containing protein [Treponema sp.]